MSAPCQCHECRNARWVAKGEPWLDEDSPASRMVLCPKCGNKRCPHATSHNNACTRSNKPGQPGSVYA